ncbi:DCN1-like protein 5 [Cucurbita maxima]|uniref:Defective in cullin neddylation protein n=1 Tax=Cucurbita maxima TaxID=3661 RepID=A0A6J1L5C0_CUCMA|nr:DCN1-like protein 5 [Cucurbita maxima]
MASPNRNRAQHAYVAPEASSPAWPTPSPRDIPITIPSSSSSPVAAALWAQLRRIDRLFDLFSGYNHVMDPHGIEKLCTHLEMNHLDVKILLLAWKMKAKKQGFFHRDEWRRGLRKLKVDNMEKLKSALFYLEIEARIPPHFEDFFAYSFKYNLIEERQTSLDVEFLCELLEIVMGPLFRPQVQLLIEFLKTQTMYRVLIMDQWMNIFYFCNQIKFPGLDNYDPNDAWPVIIDSFVEWLKRKQGAEGTHPSPRR